MDVRFVTFGYADICFVKLESRGEPGRVAYTVSVLGWGPLVGESTPQIFTDALVFRHLYKIGGAKAKGETGQNIQQAGFPDGHPL